jgi:hypothetical protein
MVLIRPLPGTSAGVILDRLREVCTATENLNSAQYRGPIERRELYLDWANKAVSALWNLVSPADLSRLVMTPAFWHIQSAAAPLANGTTLTIDNEILARKTELEQLHNDLAGQVTFWTGVPIAVPDSTMFCRHDRLEDWDLAPLLGITNDRPTHIVIPMVVIDELDRLKESGNQHTRWRARYSLAVLDRVLPDPTQFGILRDAGFEPGRVRLPGDDDEIIDQAHAVNCLSDRPITILTYDTGQSTRARARGLNCRKLPDPPNGEEPARPR